MKTLKIFVLASFFTAALAAVSLAQQDNTLYMMHKIPQSMLNNPAIQCDCNLYFSGAIMPIGGQVFLPVQVNYGNNAFSYNNLIFEGAGVTTDSLVTAFHSLADGDKFVKKRLRKVNYLTYEQQLNIFSAGYRYKKWYFTLNVSEKIEAKFSFPRDLVKLAWQGNGKDFLGENVDFTGLGLSATHYREWAFAASYKVNKKLMLGGRGKLLFGKMNMFTRKSTLTWKTDADDFDYYIHADLEMDASQPFYAVKEWYYDYEGDSMHIEEDTLAEDDFNVKEYMLNAKNKGLGLDLGVAYKFNDKIDLYFSLIDFGFIRWKDNVNTLKVKGDYTYEGWNVVPYFRKNDSISDATTDQFRDSVIRIYEPTLQKSKYTSYLTPKIYLGGTYKFHDKISAGLMARMEVFQHRLHPSITVSGISTLAKWFGASISYTYINNSFNNIGVGMWFKTGPVQYYIVTDNFTGFIWPQAARNINFRWGLNLLFGCGKPSSNVLIN